MSRKVWKRNEIKIDDTFAYNVALEVMENDEDNEPKSVPKCKYINNWPQWKDAIKAELKSLEKQWNPLPPNAYTEKLLKRFYMDKSHPLSTPMVVRTLNVEKDLFRPSIEDEEILGPKLMPNQETLEWAEINISLSLRYKRYGLYYTNPSERNVVAFADARYMFDPYTGQSQTGYVFISSNTAISWCFVKQTMSATSLNHAKIFAIHEVSRECVWLRSVIQHIRESCGISSGQDAPTAIHEDNATYRYIKGDITKHILLKFFFTHDLQKSGDIIIQKTNYGDIEFGFYPSVAPQTVEHIYKLVRLGCYNTNHFFRVDKGFVAQVADVAGGRTAPMNEEQKVEAVKPIKGEFSDVKHVRGILSMGRYSDPDSAQSSFSMLLGDAPHLDHEYAIFGKVTKGDETLKKLEELPTRREGIFVMEVFSYLLIYPPVLFSRKEMTRGVLGANGGMGMRNAKDTEMENCERDKSVLKRRLTASAVEIERQGIVDATWVVGSTMRKHKKNPVQCFLLVNMGSFKSGPTKLKDERSSRKVVHHLPEKASDVGNESKCLTLAMK
ncbi:peptidyl-prolyl cis-trans isomerase CYP23 [Tanacetum coccineum]